MAEGGSTRDYAYLHRNTSKAKFRIIAGYKGTPDVLLAMERGEVEGICGLDWSSLRAQKGDYIRDGKLNILVQTGLEPNEELTKMGVPADLEISSTTRKTAPSQNLSSRSNCSVDPTSRRRACRKQMSRSCARASSRR